MSQALIRYQLKWCTAIWGQVYPKDLSIYLYNIFSQLYTQRFINIFCKIYPPDYIPKGLSIYFHNISTQYYIPITHPHFCVEFPSRYLPSILEKLHLCPESLIFPTINFLCAVTCTEVSYFLSYLSLSLAVSVSISQFQFHAVSHS